MKKTFKATLIATVFMGLPFFAVANPCVLGDKDYNVLDATCAIAPMTYTPASVVVPSGTGDSGTPPTPGVPASVVVPSGTGDSGAPPTPGAGGTPLSVSDVKITNPIKCNTFSGFVAMVTKTAVDILMPFVVLAFIWSGFLFVRAQGNTTELEEAKSAIKWSIVGAFILLGAWGFAQIIGTTVTQITGTTSSTSVTDTCK